MCLHVCSSVFSHSISKTDAARITKLDKDTVHNEFWKPIYFGVKKSKVKITRHKNIASVGLWVMDLL